MWASHVPLLAMTQFPNLLAMMISLSLAARQQRQRQQAATATAKAKLFLLFVPLRCSPLNRGQISWPGCPKMANNKMQNERKRGSENLWQRRCRRRWCYFAFTFSRFGALPDSASVSGFLHLPPPPAYFWQSQLQTLRQTDTSTRHFSIGRGQDEQQQQQLQPALASTSASAATSSSALALVLVPSPAPAAAATATATAASLVVALAAAAGSSSSNGSGSSRIREKENLAHISIDAAREGGECKGRKWQTQELPHTQLNSTHLKLKHSTVGYSPHRW